MKLCESSIYQKISHFFKMICYLKKTLFFMVRVKRRYILFQICTKDEGNLYNPTPEELISCLQQPFTAMYGIFGCGHVWPVLKVMCWISEKRMGVFRVPRDWSSQFIDFLDSLTTINGVSLTIKVHHVSGTIDQSQRWLSENGYVIE